MKLVPLPLPNFYKKQENLRKMSTKRKKSDKKSEKPVEVPVQEAEAEDSVELTPMEPLPKTKMRSFNSVATLGTLNSNFFGFVVHFRYQTC